VEELDMLRQLIMKELNDLVDALADGAAGDYAEYKEIVGKCRGLHLVKELIDERQKQIASRDDDWPDNPSEVIIGSNPSEVIIGPQGI